MPTKYRLYVCNQLRYHFVTTRLTTDECIKILKEKVDTYIYNHTTSYKITKVQDGEDIIISKGSIKATN
jgi:hypothetical protein